jgi:hypothetical protein
MTTTSVADKHLRHDLLILNLVSSEAATLLSALRGAAIVAVSAGTTAVLVPAGRNRMFRIANVATVVQDALPRECELPSL